MKEAATQEQIDKLKSAIAANEINMYGATTVPGMTEKTFTPLRPQGPKHEAKPTSNGYAPVTEEKKKSHLVRLSDIQPQDITWLWKPYIPLGKITLMRGDPGQGKTTVSLMLASIVSNGWSFPTDDGFAAIEPGNVLYITAEDGLSDTIVPRLIKAGANRERVFSYADDAADPLYFMSPQFESLINESQPRLVIVDPIQGYLGTGVDSHRANEVRPVMHHVGRLAEKYGVAIVMIEHMSKGAPGVKGLYRGLGSIDITAAARSILFFGCNPNDENDKGIAHIKSNLAKPGKVIGYAINNDGGLVWNPNTTLTADILQGVNRNASDHGENKLDIAKRFLQDALTDGPQERADVLVDAHAAGIAEETLHRARRALGIKTLSKGFSNNKVSYWNLRDKNESSDIGILVPFFDESPNPFTDDSDNDLPV